MCAVVVQANIYRHVRCRYQQLQSHSNIIYFTTARKNGRCELFYNALFGCLLLFQSSAELNKMSVQ